MNELEQQPAKEAPAAMEKTPRQALLIEIGRRLTEAREARDEPLSKAVRNLKLRQVHLEALESGDWSSLPDDVYALGFLRQYSAYLSLDLSEDIERIKNDQYSLTRPLTFPDPPVAPSRRWAWIAAIAFVVLFVAFNIVDLGQSPAPSEPEQQQEEQTTVQTATETAAPEEPAAPEPAAETPAPPAGEAPEETAVADSQPAAEAALVAEEAEPAASSAPAEKPSVAAHQFRFDAVGDAVWLQVFLPDESGEAKGALRKEVLLQSDTGFTLSEPAETLWITCGNPFALQISVDGEVVAEAGTLGPVGKVLRDYQLKIPAQQ